MASEEVLIVGVEDSSDIVYLGKKVTKGKESAQPGKKRRPKKSSRNSNESEGCLVILDCSSGSEDGDGYVEVTGGSSVKSGKESTSGDLESVVGSPPKKVRMSSSNHSDTELAIVDVTSTKPAEEKLRYHEDSVTEDQAKVLPDSSSAVASSSKYSTTDDEQSDHASSKSTKDPPSSGTPSNQSLTGAHHERVPTCWTNCPNCPPDMQRTYHLIDVAYNSAEWSVVSNPLAQLGFVVNRVQRIQNETLWQRLCYEKKLMLRDRHDVNEQLLYHTSKSPIPVICEEGLDHRLSMNGNFGRGIYFSDSPFKCNSYWRGGGASASRYMFCCRVLLGEIKKFPKGKCEQLQREPPKPNPRPGETKFYDSVMGNLTGLNEFVVYNAYRVMPEYVICYSHLAAPPVFGPPSAAAAAVMTTSLHLSLSMPPPSALPRTIYRLASPRKKKKRKK